MRGLHLALLTGTALMAGTTSCAVYGTDLLLGGASGDGGRNGAGGTGAGGDVTGGGGGGAGSGAAPGGGGQQFCLPRATFPPPPSEEDVITPGGTREVVAAQWTIDLGDSDERGGTRFRTVGFDLDNICTDATLVGQPRGYSCRIPSYGTGMLDGPGAIDNALGSIIQTVRDLVSDFTSENYTEQLQQGRSNVIFRVTGYNGEPNDDQVRLELFVAANYDVFGNNSTPKGDGTDEWPIASDSVEDNQRDQPLFSDDLAYVTNNKLVGSLVKAGLRLDVGLSLLGNVKLNMELSGAFAMCDVVRTTQGQWGFTFENCTLGGKWNADHLLQQLSQFPDPLNTAQVRPLCTNSGSYKTFKDTICEQVDTIAGEPQPLTPCNTLAMGVKFDMRPARLGAVYPVNRVVPRCPAEFEPSEDTCASLAGAGGGTGAGGRAGAGGATGAGGAGGAGGTTDAGTDARSDAAPADASDD